jgi:hypothetical protein
LAFQDNHFKENNGRAQEESSHIRRGSEFITKFRSELDFLLMDMSNEAEKVKHLKKRVEDKKKARKSNEEQQLAGNSRNSS